MSTRSTDVMFLLGAGASVEAEIPMSMTMIGEIEQLLQTNGDWQEHLGLYNHVKSAIHYSAGLKGKFGKEVLYNIETLVNSLYELEKNEEHPLYPFIASWNSRFVALAGTGFENVRYFRRLILKQLKKWMCPENAAKGDYYQGFVRIQNELNYPLRLFSLNYDLCVDASTRRSFESRLASEATEPITPGIGKGSSIAIRHRIRFRRSTYIRGCLETYAT